MRQAEYSKSNPNALLGDGDIDWVKALTLLKTKGRNQWLIVEAESTDTTPLDCIEKNLVRLKALRAKADAASK
jgi:sugar phosphate isomerase/epimerase